MKAIRILALLLAVLMLVGVVTACGGGDETTTTTAAPADPTPPSSGKTLAQALVEAGFGVVGEQNASSTVTTATSSVLSILKEVDKWIRIQDDFTPAQAGEKDITIGRTRRENCVTYSDELLANRVNSNRDWRIIITAEKVMILGATDAGICEALAQFGTMLRADSSLYYPSYDSGLTQYNWPLTQLGNQPIQNYKIVLPAGASTFYQTKATELQTAVFNASGFTLPIIDDTQSAGTTELILGATTRPVSAGALTALQATRPNHAKDGIAYATQTQISVLGATDGAFEDALLAFCADYLSDAAQAQVANINKPYQAEGLKPLKFGTTDAGQYQIVVAKNAPFDLRVVADQLQTLLYEGFGYDVKIVTDDTAPVNGQKEILLGQTSRPATTTLSLTAYNAKIDANGNVVLDAGHYTGVQKMYTALLEELDGQTASQTPVVQANYNGTVTDIALTWQADKDQTLVMQGGNNGLGASGPYTLKNQDFLTNFDYNANYTMTWNDEFDGESLDYDKWSLSTTMNISDIKLSGDEPYIKVENGELVLTATYNPNDSQKPYTTAYGLVTYDTMNFSGGYLEMRAKVPFSEGGLGEWASFWGGSGTNVLFFEAYRDAHDGELIDYGYHTEVDFFEQNSYNDKNWGNYCLEPNLHKWFDKNYKQSEGDEALYTHNTKAPHRATEEIGPYRYKFTDRATAADWHTYGFLWTEDFMAVSVDGQFYWSFDITVEGNAWTDRLYNVETQQWEDIGMGAFQPENSSMDILINHMFFTPAYAQEHAWAEWNSIKSGTENQLFPCVYTIDYMRLYQRAGEKIYTPKTVGDGDKYFSSSRWDYALNGNSAQE